VERRRRLENIPLAYKRNSCVVERIDRVALANCRSGGWWARGDVFLMTFSSFGSIEYNFV